MKFEDIFVFRMIKAINKGFFSEMKELEEGNALIIHQPECTASDEDESCCNCIPDLTVAFMGKTFRIDEEGVVINQVMN